MVRSCPLAELFSALTQSGYSKSTQSRATKHGVGLGGKPRCDCVKQQNDPFVLRSQPCRQHRAASSVRFLQQFLCRNPDPLRTEAVQRTRDVINNSNGPQKRHLGCMSLTLTD